MATKLTLYPNNDQQLRIDGIADQNGISQAGATIAATLFDSKNVAVTGLTSMAFTDVGGTAGSYVAQVSGSVFNPAVGSYTLLVSGTTVEGAKFQFKVSVTISQRTL